MRHCNFFFMWTVEILISSSGRSGLFLRLSRVFNNLAILDLMIGCVLLSCSLRVCSVLFLKSLRIDCGFLFVVLMFSACRLASSSAPSFWISHLMSLFFSSLVGIAHLPLPISGVVGMAISAETISWSVGTGGWVISQCLQSPKKSLCT